VERLQKIRLGFTEKQPWIDPAAKGQESYFVNVKLVQIISAGGGPGLGSMSFKIVGNIR